MERILKRKKKKINKMLYVVYEFKRNDNAFVIECTQYNYLKNTIDNECVRLETAKKSIAKSIFRTVVRNIVLEGTLGSVIEDQMC